MAQILVFYGVIAAIMVVVELIINDEAGYYITPTNLYRHTEMNKLFCFIIFLALGIISPFMFIGKVLYWLAHIGRQDF